METNEQSCPRRRLSFTITLVAFTDNASERVEQLAVNLIGIGVQLVDVAVVVVPQRCQ